MDDLDRRLLLLRRAGLLESPPEEVYDRLTRLAKQATGAPVALFSLVEKERQSFKSSQGLTGPGGKPVQETPIRLSMCRTVVGTDAPLELPDAADDPVFCDHPAVLELSVRAYLGFPVRAPDGTPLGSLCVLDYAPRAWTEEDRATIGDLADLASREVALRLERRSAEDRAEFYAGESRFLRGVIDAIPGALALLDEDLVPILSNATWDGFLASAVFRGPRLLEEDEVRAGLRALRDGRELEFTWERHLRDGEEDRWIRFRAVSTQLDGGPGILARFEDLTDVRDTEKELRLLREAVDHSRDLFLVTDAVEEPGNAAEPRRPPTILLANAAFYAMTGYAPHEVIGRPLHLPHPDAEGEAARLREAYLEGRSVRAQILNRKKSGERFWVEVDMVPVTDLEGRRTHWVSVQRDISLRRAHERRLAEQEEALRVQDRLEVVGRLAGGIAHDFNNLLTVVLSNLELLLMDEPRDSARPEIEDALASTREARGLVRQLLALSRRQILVEEEVALDELVREVAAVLRRATGRRHRIRVEQKGTIPMTWADRVQLEQVLLNLGMNAGAAMDEPGAILFRVRLRELEEPDPTVDGGMLPPGTYLDVVVEDGGPGVPEALQDRIFEPFFTTRPLGEGRGLGLSTALGIARQMGGEVEVGVSEALGGAAFTLRIPVRERPARVDQVPPASGGS
jgi:PAS domain S-box-containing protein